MANQFPTESTTSGMSSTTGGSSTGSGPATSIGTASGLGGSSGMSSSGSGSGLGSSSSSGSGSGLGSTSSSGSGMGSGSGLGSGTGGTSAGSGSGSSTATAQRTMDRAVQATHEVVDRAAGTVGQAAERLRTRYDHLMEMEQEWADTARTRVRENPLGAIAIALAVGLVVGRLTSHR